jgi:hypothetical protein
LADERPPVARTKHGELDLNQIAEQLPGMARLMVEVSDRFWLLYYAAKGGNWDLARHELSETRKAFQLAAIVRPKYQEALDAFDLEHMVALQNAIKAEEFGPFERVYRDAIDIANELHVTLGYSYIDWRLPKDPPAHLRLTRD